MTKKRNRYSNEFTHEAINLVEEQGRKITDIASSLGIGRTTLEKWVYQHRKEQQGIAQTQGRALTLGQREIQQIRKEVKQLKMQRDILNEEG